MLVVKIHNILNNPISWGVVAFVFASIAASGRLSVTLSNILLIAAFLVGCFGVYRSGYGIHLVIIFCLILGIVLTAISWWLQPSSKEKLADEQLSNAAIELAAKMRDLEIKYDREERIRSEEQSSRLRTPRDKDYRGEQGEREEALRIWQENQAYSTRHRADFESEFKNNMLGQAVYLKDEIAKRLPEKVLREMEPDTKDIRARSPFTLANSAFQGRLSGPYPVNAAADYLEKLARKLSPNLGKPN